MFEIICFDYFNSRGIFLGGDYWLRFCAWYYWCLWLKNYVECAISWFDYQGRIPHSTPLIIFVFSISCDILSFITFSYDFVGSWIKIWYLIPIGWREFLDLLVFRNLILFCNLNHFPSSCISYLFSDALITWIYFVLFLFWNLVLAQLICLRLNTYFASFWSWRS